jgi:RNase P/RNase MRP subunit p30
VYCSEHKDGDVFLTQPNAFENTETDNNDASKLTSVEQIRSSLLQGGAGSLLILESLCDHRKIAKKSKASSDLVSVYPDVLKVCDVML